jgi:predicted alpha/beta hydrolase
MKLWNIAWDLWEHRNGILHEGGNLITQSMTVQLNARVSWFYNDLSSRALRQYDRYLVHHSLYTLLRKDNNYKITWLLVAEPVIRSSRLDDWRENSRTDQTVNSMRRCMFAWLRR